MKALSTILTTALLLPLLAPSAHADRRRAKPTRPTAAKPVAQEAADMGATDSRRDDFAFELRDSSGDQHLAWTFTKFTTLRVGDACWAKLLDDKQNDEPVTRAMAAGRNLTKFATAVTGDDWSHIENQPGAKETNRKLVEPMMDEFASKVRLTVIVEGDDCDVTFNGLWLRYWWTATEALAKYPPAAGKASITVTAAAKAKDISVTVDKTGSKFTIVAPRDLQPVDWGERIYKVFRKVAKAQ